MCGESWLAIKDLQPTAPVLKAGHPGVLDSLSVGILVPFSSFIYLFWLVGYTPVCLLVPQFQFLMGWISSLSSIIYM